MGSRPQWVLLPYSFMLRIDLLWTKPHDLAYITLGKQWHQSVCKKAVRCGYGCHSNSDWRWGVGAASTSSSWFYSDCPVRHLSWPFLSLKDNILGNSAVGVCWTLFHKDKFASTAFESVVWDGIACYKGLDREMTALQEERQPRRSCNHCQQQCAGTFLENVRLSYV
jgi:hypothetical protein